MTLINVAGTYRGPILDRAVNTSKNGYPQFIVKLRGDQFYDEDVEEFVQLQDANEITAYLILFDGQDKETLSCAQIQKVLGWDGVSFAELSELDCLEKEIQFRVAESLYKEKVNYQVEWIDEHDAKPGGAIKKLDSEGLAALDAKYKAKMKSAAPASAQTKKEKPKPLAAATAKAAKAEIIAETTEEIKAPPLAPAAEAKAEVKVKTTNERVGKLTKENAWAMVWKKKDPKITQAKITKIWKDRVQQVAGKKTDEEITEEEWYQIAIAVNDETGVIPF